MDVHARTDRLVLRRFTEDDADLLIELDSDPEVMHFITGGRTTPPEEIRDDILPAFLAYYRRGPAYGFWAIESRQTGEFLGWVHLRAQPGDPADEPELGYRLRRSAWGHGYAAEASRAVVDRAFTEFGATRVVANTMAVNTGSRRVMEKVGMQYVRTFFQPWPDPIPGDELGDVEYELTRERWERQRP